MALCACKCLNVTLESENFEEIFNTEKLELSLTEQRDIFFSEKLLLCSLRSLKTLVVQPALVGQRIVGRYTVESCLACGQTTHAISNEKNIVLITKAIQTSLEQINNLKKSENFSPVFNLLVPEVTSDIEMKENVDTNNQLVSDRNGCSPSFQVIGTLRKQLNQTLQTQLEAIEETVRQFRDQKYAEYEAYRERAQRDHKILSSIVSKARNNIEKDSWANNSSLDNGPPSPLLPPLQRRRLSSIKDAKKFNQNIKTNVQISHEEDSLDAEDIFDLEGTDSRNYMVSDQDDYDSDQGSNDEGIHIARSRGIPAADIARSLPINMPKFPQEQQPVREIDDYGKKVKSQSKARAGSAPAYYRPTAGHRPPLLYSYRSVPLQEEPQDIAASIKALARSVHGDVFELPRPRFSTQI